MGNARTKSEDQASEKKVQHIMDSLNVTNDEVYKALLEYGEILRKNKTPDELSNMLLYSTEIPAKVIRYYLIIGFDVMQGYFVNEIIEGEKAVGVQ